ncbi:rhodanese-like domain-containing protein [Curtobacterium flaccumfaciens]|uniref:Rhodanese-like domain-containing protein n=1 Tax=Curtobacterium flaccumfaciens TaxID=2035 RepID=A0A4R6DG60_9MICO|nr:rhodanese-like domain-containing protein [Curtobacterium flaccumfaciens]TDN43675.1 rhodanese-like domain-containing protein [Curtobacterium flaccumfaciens]
MAPVLTSPLVSTQWLADHLGADELVVLDASVHAEGTGLDTMWHTAQDTYEQRGHVPGARYADLVEAFSTPQADVPFTRPGAERFEAAARDLGVTNTSTVVVYDDSLGEWSARLWWIFRSFGFDSVAVLDGGFTKWRDEGRPVRVGALRTPARRTSGAPTPTGGTPADEAPAVTNKATTATSGTPADEAPAATMPASGTPANGSPVDETLIDGTRPDTVPAGGTRADRAPADRASATVARVDCAPADGTSAASTPTDVFLAGEERPLWADHERVRRAVSGEQPASLVLAAPQSSLGTEHPPVVPGSTSIALDTIVDPKTNAYLRGPALAAAFAEVIDAEEIVTYCGVGSAACVDALALTVLGHEKVRVYDGSLLDWWRREPEPLAS